MELFVGCGALLVTFQSLRRRRQMPSTLTTARAKFPTYEDLIGNTPLIDISIMASPKVSGITILGKAEFLNPGFSMKDRIALNIIKSAERKGKLRPGDVIVCASSGNTGASVAMICAMRGYAAVIITNEKCSEEKCAAIRAYGATLRIARADQNYMEMEASLAEANPTWFAINQYESPANAEAHFLSTGPEIWRQTHGSITHFVMGGSTGGTVSGTGKFLKSKNPLIKVIMPDPSGSVIANVFKTGGVGKKGTWLVEGMGKGSIPGAMDLSVVDGVVTVKDEDAFWMCRQLAQKTGLLVGGSAGMNVYAAIELANSLEEPATIVTVLCDLGVKYLTKIYNPDWVAQHIGVQQGETKGSLAARHFELGQD